MTAALLIDLCQTYAWIGAGVALVFLTIGIDRIDEDARGAYVMRPLLIPAILLIWPLVLWRWFRMETGRIRWQAHYTPPRASHAVAAGLMSVIILFALLAGFALRESWPADAPAVQLTQPGGDG